MSSGKDDQAKASQRRALKVQLQTHKSARDRENNPNKRRRLSSQISDIRSQIRQLGG